MNTLHKIAHAIRDRGQREGWKAGQKTTDKLNLEAWAGACFALEVIDHPDAHRVAMYVVLAIASRGYSETLKLAEKASIDGQEVKAAA